VILDGNCGCGVLTLLLETARTPAELPVRMCGCTFCLARTPHYTSDPAGHVTIKIADEAQVERYRFGLRLADFLICKRCDKFVAAVDSGRAVVNLDVLARAAEFTAAPLKLTIYDTEDVAARTARRAANWMPVTLILDT
jgi:hypothetical protein